MADKKKITTSKHEISERRMLLKELPYYNYTGSLIMLHGQFNNSLMDKHQPTKYESNCMGSTKQVTTRQTSSPLEARSSLYSLF